MEIGKLRSAVASGNIEWNRHALERMPQRGILRKTVKEVLLTGEIRNLEKIKSTKSRADLGKIW